MPVTTGTYTAHEFLITLFLFITAPVSAHMIAKAHLHEQGNGLDPNPSDQVEAGLPPTGTPAGWATFHDPNETQDQGTSRPTGPG